MNKKYITYILSLIAILVVLYAVFVKKGACGNPKNWGPKMWYTLHVISLQYPDNPSNEEKKAAFNLIYSLEHLLPCTICKDHLRGHLSKNPLTFDQLSNKNTFSKYVYDLHENVNKQLGKSSKIKFEDIKKLYNCA